MSTPSRLTVTRLKPLASEPSWLDILAYGALGYCAGKYVALLWTSWNRTSEMKLEEKTKIQRNDNGNKNDKTKSSVDRQIQQNAIRHYYKLQTQVLGALVRDFTLFKLDRQFKMNLALWASCLDPFHSRAEQSMDYVIICVDRFVQHQYLYLESIKQDQWVLQEYQLLARNLKGAKYLLSDMKRYGQSSKIVQ